MHQGLWMSSSSLRVHGTPHGRMSTADTTRRSRVQMGITPLMRAAGQGHATLVQLLLDAGAGINLEDLVGRIHCFQGQLYNTICIVFTLGWTRSLCACSSHGPRHPAGALLTSCGLAPARRAHRQHSSMLLSVATRAPCSCCSVLAQRSTLAG